MEATRRPAPDAWVAHRLRQRGREVRHNVRRSFGRERCEHLKGKRCMIGIKPEIKGVNSAAIRGGQHSR
jgi:hypothetical protein